MRSPIMVAHAEALRDDATDAKTPPPSPPPHGDEAASDAYEEEFFHHGPNRGGLRRLVTSLVRLIDIQYKIWVTEAKLAVAKILTAIALFGGAALVGILGVIFLFIGVFHVLTDVIGLAPVWAYLIFAVLQLALAVTLVLVAKSVLTKHDTPKKPHGGSHS